jgi:hypothetical protein
MSISITNFVFDNGGMVITGKSGLDDFLIEKTACSILSFTCDDLNIAGSKL